MIQKESRSAVRARRHLRVRAKISGTAECPRLVVFRSNKHIEAQLIDDTKGITLASLEILVDDGNGLEQYNGVYIIFCHTFIKLMVKNLYGFAIQSNCNSSFHNTLPFF